MGAAGVLDLADTLERAGYDDAQVLAHLGEPTHVMGCWMLDLVLGKQ